MGQYQILQDEIIEGNKYFIIETSRSYNAKKQIIDHLLHQRHGLKEVHSVDECDVILVFCPIVSRAGTDIDAALKKLDNACSETFRPVIFMVLHPTFDPYKIVPDSSRFINRMNTLTVDFLFSEDEGLLKCSINDEALNKIVYHFKSQKKDCMVYLILAIVAIVVLLIINETKRWIYPIVIIGIVIYILYSVQVLRKH